MKTRLGRPGGQWHEKKVLNPNLQTSGIFHFEIPQIQRLETDVLRLRRHSNRKIGKECELVNFNFQDGKFLLEKVGII